MKIQLSDSESITISAVQVANEIYAQGRYLKDNFRAEDLTEPGEDFSGSDVRLQVRDGGWQLHFGDSQYDQDHRGYWACASVPRACTRAEAREIADELLSSVE